MRLSTKLLIICELVLLLLALALLLPTRASMRDQVIGDLKNQLAAVASTAVLQLDAVTHTRVRQAPDEAGEAFQSLREVLRAVRDANDLESDHLYTFYLGEDHQLHFAVMPHEGEPFIGEAYPMKDHHRAALSTGRTATSGLYEDANGRWISAAAPILLPRRAVPQDVVSTPVPPAGEDPQRKPVLAPSALDGAEAAAAPDTADGRENADDFTPTETAEAPASVDDSADPVAAAAPPAARAGATTIDPRDVAPRVVGLLEVTQPAAAYFARYRRLVWLNFAIALLGLGVTSLLGYLVLRRLVIGPVGAIREGVSALARHDFNHRVNLTSRDEFQELGESLNQLATQLNAARAIQAGFFPQQLPEPPGYRMAGASEPCDATGGDYYDAFVLDEHRTAVVVADVTGHGLGPSLLMATCRSALHALAKSGHEPGPLLHRLEDQLAPDLTDGRFITMILGVLHRDGTFTYANAGHAPALVHSVRHGTQRLPSHRPPLGIVIPHADSEHYQSTLQLEPGDQVFLASDGVIESQNADDRHYGHEPVEALLRTPGLSCGPLVERLREELQAHRHPRRADDDVTILCIDRIAIQEVAG